MMEKSHYSIKTDQRRSSPKMQVSLDFLSWNLYQIPILLFALKSLTRCYPFVKMPTDHTLQWSMIIGVFLDENGVVRVHFDEWASGESEPEMKMCEKREIRIINDRQRWSFFDRMVGFATSMLFSCICYVQGDLKTFYYHLSPFMR